MRFCGLGWVMVCASVFEVGCGGRMGSSNVVAAAKSANGPEYTVGGEMIAPKNYREWVFLSSGFDMSYTARTGVPDHSVFDNVFVNPEAYAGFLATGVWPDRTVMVLENRVAQAKGEVLVKDGRFQGREIVGMEIHVKDASRFREGGVDGAWAFFDVGADGKGKMFARTEDCYACHREHAAADTTFVQFYPTLMGVAEGKKTLSEAYLKERGAGR